MHSYHVKRFSLALIALAVTVLVSGCGSDHSDSAPAPAPPAPPTMATFEITLVNLTAGQPLSPLVAVAHTEGFNLFKEGDVANSALEAIAESGSTEALKSMIADSRSAITSVAGPMTPLLPGPGNETKVSITVPLNSVATTRLSLAVMLGNTNDGFTGIAGESLASIPVEGMRRLDLVGYDAGTERNTESADTVPGPATAASGGKREGVNPGRDDVINTVHVHPGVVGMEDGLPGSALSQAQRWDNPVARLTIRRIQ